MLGKLLKYEFKSTSRVLWFLYAGLIVVALLFGIVLRVEFNLGDILFTGTAVEGGLDTNIFMTILMSALGIIYMLLIYAIFITTTVVIVMRFYKNMLGGEGYLMHTLPVKTSNLILSKLITAFCWMLIAGAVVVISTIVLGLSSGFITALLKNVDFREIMRGLNYIFSQIGMSGWTFMLLILISTISTIVLYYLSMAIGNIANNHKFLFSVLAYVGIQIVFSIILTAFSVVMGRTGYLLGTSYDMSWFSNYIWTMTGIQVVLGVGGFFLTNYLLSKKLNLA
ncbi:MAG: hypothetical protein J5928_00970 [Firmicutes bacterium]|nr:hypothetical protein [Bacillota bacterium]